MSVKEQTCFQLVCDGCGELDFNGDYHPHWDSPMEARGSANEFADFGTAWLLDHDGKDYCYECRQTKFEHAHVYEDGVCDICCGDELDDDEVPA